MTAGERQPLTAAHLDSELEEPRDLSTERLAEIARQCLLRWDAYPSIPGGLRWKRNGITAVFALAGRVRAAEERAEAAEAALAEREDALRMLRDAWNAHMDSHPVRDAMPTWEQLREWENAPSNTASADLAGSSPDDVPVESPAIREDGGASSRRGSADPAFLSSRPDMLQTTPKAGHIAAPSSPAADPSTITASVLERGRDASTNVGASPAAEAETMNCAMIQIHSAHTWRAGGKSYRCEGRDSSGYRGASAASGVSDTREGGRRPVLPGGDHDACPRCGIHRKYAGYLMASCGEDFTQPGCFVIEQVKQAASPVPAVADDPEPTCTCGNGQDAIWHKLDPPCDLLGPRYREEPAGPGSRDTKEAPDA